LNECLKQAINSKKIPFFISDMGDNPTAGGAGDVTWTLNKLLNKEEFKSNDGPKLIYASIPGPKLIEKAIQIGVGKKVKGYVGAEVDNRYSPPILLEGVIKSIKKGDINAETEVVIQIGSISVIVTKKRKPYHYEKDFSDLGLDLINTDIVVVKIGYLVPELYEIQKGWLMALTPGGVDQDLDRLGYKNIKRPMFPIDKDMKDPNLSARMVPVSGN
jgi:microcystin degradation protein MlrC